MSTLGDAVKLELVGRGIDGDRIETILLGSDVSSTASRGVPVRLSVRRLRVTGMKTYSEMPDV